MQYSPYQSYLLISDIYQNIYSEPCTLMLVLQNLHTTLFEGMLNKFCCS